MDDSNKKSIFGLALPVIVILFFSGIIISVAIFVNHESQETKKKFNALTSAEVTSNNAAEVANSIAQFMQDECLSRVKESNPEKCLQFDSSYSLLSSSQMQELKNHYSVAHRFIKQAEQEEKRRAAEARDKAIADGSYMPSESEIRPACEKLAEARSLTGRVNWGWFNYSWFPEMKTLILKGKTKNAFGVEIPFSAKCKWEKGGNIRLVEII